MNNLVEVVPAVMEPKLPATYEAARTAIEQCAKIDECKDWADKAAAMKAYAIMSHDRTLHNLALRIQLRAERRCGELYEKVESQPGKRTDIEPSGGAPTRLQTAAAAGISKDQMIQSQRIAHVPKEDFDAQVESEDPPTVTQLAGQGKRRPRSKAATTRKYRSVDIANDLGSVTSVKQGDSSSKLDLELESSFSALRGQKQNPAAETILREALPQLLIERNPDRAKDAAAAAMEASGAKLAEELDDKFNQLLERAKEAQLASLRAEFGQSVQREVEKRLSGETKRDIDRARGDVEIAQQLEQIWRHRATKCIGALRLFAENWSTLIGCLHPDRSDHLLSDERQARMSKASDVVTRMKDMIEGTEYKQ
jgi:hypothetical protein